MYFSITSVFISVACTVFIGINMHNIVLYTFFYKLMYMLYNMYNTLNNIDDNLLFLFSNFVLK